MITSVLLIALPVCFGNWTANALVTERILQITFFCVLLIWQNPANMLNTNYLSFIYSFLLSLAFLLLMHAARHSYASQLYHANVPIGLIAQNMGRNPSEIQTYLKDFDTINIVEANNKSLIVGQDLYKELAAKEEEKRHDKIRQQLKDSGDIEGLERYEAYLKWREEH